MGRHCTAARARHGTSSLRYRYCVQVGAVALESVIHDAPSPPQPDTISDGFVNLIWNREPSRPDSREEVEEPIEGCTQHKVGWVRVAYQDVMVDVYHYLRDWNDWYSEYRRPPQVARA